LCGDLGACAVAACAEAGGGGRRSGWSVSAAEACDLVCAVDGGRRIEWSDDVNAITRIHDSLTFLGTT